MRILLAAAGSLLAGVALFLVLPFFRSPLPAVHAEPALLALPDSKETADRKEAPVSKPAVRFSTQVAPVLAKYCVSCHGGAKPKGNFALDKIKDDADATKSRNTWEKVIQALEAGEMPPPGKKMPSTEEREVVVTFLNQQLGAPDCTKKRDPGRLTLRRLNRVEYNNTVRDLLGVQVKPADDFPADDIGYGFDNIGDVLTLPPLLLEKYLNAAEAITSEMFKVLPAQPANRRRFNDTQLRTFPRLRERINSAYPIAPGGEAYGDFNVYKTAEHTLAVRAGAQNTDGKPFKLVVKIDDKVVKTFEVKESSLSRFEFTHRIEAGNHRITAVFEKPESNPDPKPEPKKDTRPEPEKDPKLLPTMPIEYIDVVSPPQPAEHTKSYERLMIAKADGKNDEDAARQVIESLTRRAYRRPVKKDDVERLLRLYRMARKQGDDHDKGVELMVQAVLVSPHFLFRIESDPQPGNPELVHPVSEHELATRLSYFLWSTMPDDELFRKAEEGTLRKELDQQVKRMLADPKSKSLVENFAGQWLMTRNLKAMSPDPGVYPRFDDRLRQAMIQETELFFAEIVREDRSILDFIDADFTFVNERLADHYGIKGVRGPEFRKVKLEDGQRGGILTQASLLTVTSNPTRTSPVKRGKWIMENILNTPPPPPPPGAGELSEDKKAVESASLRERMELHRKDPNCATCHARMDPLGFAFENYDGIGAWRTMDGKFKIDAAGTLPGGRGFKGAGELKKILKERKNEFSRCLAEKLLTYAVGRGVEYGDKCVLDDLVKVVEQKDYRFSALVLAVVKCEPFQLRRGNPGGSKK
jgi:mono/diheme cytochrome c family protein